MEIQTALRGLRSLGEISNTRILLKPSLGGESYPVAAQACVPVRLGRSARAEADASLTGAHTGAGTKTSTKVTGEGVIGARHVVRASRRTGSLTTCQGRSLKALLSENSGLGILLQSVSPPPVLESPSRVKPKGL